MANRRIARRIWPKDVLKHTNGQFTITKFDVHAAIEACNLRGSTPQARRTSSNTTCARDVCGMPKCSSMLKLFCHTSVCNVIEKIYRWKPARVKPLR